MILTDINGQNRQNWLARTLAQIPADSRILDAGAGELKNKIYGEHLQYTSQDFCQFNEKAGSTTEGLHTANWGQDYIDLVCDVTNIPVPYGSFDAVLCSEVLEHVPDPTLALNEFTRFLKRAGS